MSALTDEPIVPVVRQYAEEEQDDWTSMWKKRPAAPHPSPRRIIDVTKEALVLMAEALEEIGDTYAIYGFSGQGRENVEFYHVNHFLKCYPPPSKDGSGHCAQTIHPYGGSFAALSGETEGRCLPRKVIGAAQ